MILVSGKLAQGSVFQCVSIQCISNEKMLRVIAGADLGALEWRKKENRVIPTGQTSDINRSVQLLEERV